MPLSASHPNIRKGLALALFCMWGFRAVGVMTAWNRCPAKTRLSGFHPRDRNDKLASNTSVASPKTAAATWQVGAATATKPAETAIAVLAVMAPAVLRETAAASSAKR